MTTPPAVVCPGCTENVEREHETIVNGVGEVQFHIATQSDHEALIEHWDHCPAQQL